jgi:hypothetical protein
LESHQEQEQRDDNQDAKNPENCVPGSNAAMLIGGYFAFVAKTNSFNVP